MFNIILFEPEIPPNTGNIIRLAANTGAHLHLVKPLGFELDEPRLKRAGLDYREFARVETHDDLHTCLRVIGEREDELRVYPISTRGKTRYTEAGFRKGDALLFGPESRGLPASVLEEYPPEQRLTIPMQPGSRSLNLSNAVAIVLYEALRQVGY